MHRDFKEPIHAPDFKRPLDPKRVLQILEYRRVTLKFIESMLQPNISLDELKNGEDFICRHDYDSITQERYLQKLCGFPLCSNELSKEWKQRYHISLKDKRIYDVEIRKLYCSVKCMDESTKFRNESVPEQPIWMRPEDIKFDLNF